MTDRATIGNGRAAFRVARGLRQVDLAAKASVGLATVHAAELGRSLSEATLRAISSALGVPIGDYADGRFAVPTAPAGAA